MSTFHSIRIGIIESASSTARENHWEAEIHTGNNNVEISKNAYLALLLRVFEVLKLHGSISYSTNRLTAPDVRHDMSIMPDRYP